MAAPALPRLYTREEMKHWPESNVRTELVDGELVVSPSPTPRHQHAVGKLFLALSAFVTARDLGSVLLGPLDVVLAPTVVYQPDILFVASERESIIGEGNLDAPPDLAIEVISEHNRSHDTSVKFQHYEQYGVKEYWMVDHRDQHIRVYVLADGKYKLVGAFASGSKVVSTMLPGLELDAAEIL